MSKIQPVGKILLLKGNLKRLVEEVEARTSHPVLVSLDRQLDVAAEIGFDDETDGWILTLKNPDVPKALIGHELCHLFQFSDPAWKETRISLDRGAGERNEFLRDWIQSLLWDPWADAEASSRGFDICGYAYPYFVRYVESLKEFDTRMERTLTPVDIAKLAIDYTYKALDANLCGFRKEWRECEREFRRVAPRARKLGSAITKAMQQNDVQSPEGVALAFLEILSIIDDTLPALDIKKHLLMRTRLVTETPLAYTTKADNSRSRRPK